MLKIIFADKLETLDKNSDIVVNNSDKDVKIVWGMKEIPQKDSVYESLFFLRFVFFGIC